MGDGAANSSPSLDLRRTDAQPQPKQTEWSPEPELFTPALSRSVRHTQARREQRQRVSERHRSRSPERASWRSNGYSYHREPVNRSIENFSVQNPVVPSIADQVSDFVDEIEMEVLEKLLKVDLSRR